MVLKMKAPCCMDVNLRVQQGVFEFYFSVTNMLIFSLKAFHLFKNILKTAYEC